MTHHQPKIALISTGGTIAMRFDSKKNGMVPAMSGQDLITAVPELANYCEIESINFANIPSAQITPADMQKLALTTEALLQREDIVGVVITHGTDTVEESAYFLELFTQCEKPICFTAAMRTSSEVSPDGPNNILSAVRVAIDPHAMGRGVMLVANNEVHSASRVTKTHTGNVKTFASPFWGPIGYVDHDRVIFQYPPAERLQLRSENALPFVPILKAYTGMNQDWIQALMTLPMHGLVIEGFGRGNFPTSSIPMVEQLTREKIPVVITSRVLGGRVLDVYAADGAGGDLHKKGAILGGELSSQKARIKLMLALAANIPYQQLHQLF